MKINNILLSFALFGATLFSSCIKKEPANMEADITAASIQDLSEIEGDPEISNNTILFHLQKDYVGNFEFSPQFELTPGATIQPENGTTLNFSHSQNYTVTSEDGAWTKTYKVSFQIAGQDTIVNFSFENADTINTTSPEGHYEEFYHIIQKNGKSDTIKNWGSGNPGFNILAATLVPDGKKLTPDFYPTAQTTAGYEGKGVVLQTKGTGPLGGTFGSPLAAGNLYIGTFKLDFPTVKSPRFGLPYNHTKAPKALTGFFKYKAGDNLEVNNEPTKLSRDTWDAYAILFEKSNDDNNYLQVPHIFDSPKIVGIAHLSDDQSIETDQWTKFYIPFKYKEDKSFDPNKKYMYTIVFTSSKEGNQFNGAKGSKLYIDEVQLLTED